MRTALPNTTIWARLPVVPSEWIDCLQNDTCPPAQTGDGPDMDTLKRLGMAALAAGADGLVMWGYEYAAYTLDDRPARWEQLKGLASWFDERSGVFMAGIPSQIMAVDNTSIGVFQRETDKLHYAYLVNPTTGPISAKVTLPGDEGLRCLAGIEGSDMELTADLVQDVTLQGGEIRRITLGEPRRIEQK